jgi:hypothetical protein
MRGESMVLTEYKSPEELKHSLGEAKRLAVFSCAGCANMNKIGGRRGLRFLKAQLEGYGYEVVVAKTPVGCCSAAVMESAVGTHIKPKRSQIDALVLVSCGAGIKNANYFNPGLSVVAAADPIGVETLLPHGAYYPDHGDDLVAYGLCTPCGHCVLSFTTGICPYVECASKLLYGPCEKALREGESGRCHIDASRICVWRTIEERGGDLESLRELKRLHEDGTYQRIPSVAREPSAHRKYKTVGFVGARVLVPFADMVHLIR